MMSSKRLSAGETVEARCTKCRQVLNHTIVAMVEEKIVRVKCNTCNGMHNYHPVAPEKPAKGVAQRKTPTTGGVKKDSPKKNSSFQDQEEWSALRPHMNLEKAVTYSMTAKYRLADLIDHASFGLGVVKTIPAPNKMEVLF